MPPNIAASTTAKPASGPQLSHAVPLKYVRIPAKAPTDRPMSAPRPACARRRVIQPTSEASTVCSWPCTDRVIASSVIFTTRPLIAVPYRSMTDRVSPCHMEVLRSGNVEGSCCAATESCCPASSRAVRNNVVRALDGIRMSDCLQLVGRVESGGLSNDPHDPVRTCRGSLRFRRRPIRNDRRPSDRRPDSSWRRRVVSAATHALPLSFALSPSRRSVSNNSSNSSARSTS
jgi:hypothetical protein